MYLVAMRTVFGFGVGQRSVRLPMPSQVAGRAVTFLALRTLAVLDVRGPVVPVLFLDARKTNRTHV